MSPPLLPSGDGLVTASPRGPLGPEPWEPLLPTFLQLARRFRSLFQREAISLPGTEHPQVTGGQDPVGSSRGPA